MGKSICLNEETFYIISCIVVQNPEILGQFGLSFWDGERAEVASSFNMLLFKNKIKWNSNFEESWISVFSIPGTFSLSISLTF